MKTLEELIREFDLEIEEVRTWIEEGWVRPVWEQSTCYFSEIDVARLRMIRDLFRDLSIESESIPIVLSLVDQIHFLRRKLQDMSESISELPEAFRDQVLRRLRDL